ncbi:MAG: PIG-L family deacetylase [Chthoniobacterales bacterium]|nr:PIG-L family deacetylase [Chthoniobacterales bacterium]
MDLFIPTNISFTQATPQITHLGIGAHQDDLEIMALHGILECYQNPTQHFGGIVCTNGSGSPRTGSYATCDDEKMKSIRQEEQRQAARLGKYLFVAQLDHPSAEVQNASNNSLVDELHELLLQLHPEVIYTHHPLDKHPTHRAVCRAVIEALRRLPSNQHLKRFLGGEVWRGLDWVVDEDKIALDASARPELSEKLLAIFDSQISGGKRYDLAARGRWQANATFASPHTIDKETLVSYAIDLMPLLKNPQLTLSEFALGFVERFRKEIEKQQKI